MVELIDKLNYNDLSVISVPVDTEGLISSEVLERGLSDLLQGRELRQLTETKLPQQSQWVLTPLRIFESYGRLLKYIPGRKTLVYFSPGQGNPEAFGRDAGDVPWRLYDPVYQARFLNDANITLLAINPLGLQATVHSSLPIDPAYEAGAVKTKQGRRALVRKAQAGSSGTALANEFLKTIAQETGGEAVTSSNDISGSLRKLFGRNESYYLLSYTSSNELPDGRFRRVQVRTNFPKLTVAHRSGYLASMSVPGLSTTERLLLTWIIAAQKRSDFQISTEVSPITTEGATSYLPFKVAVPMKQLPMKKEINEQGKEMYSCKVLIAGALRQLSRQWLYKSISFELDSTTYQRYIGENFIYSDRLQLDKFGNDELIVIVASPDLTKVGSTSTNLDAKSP